MTFDIILPSIYHSHCLKDIISHFPNVGRFRNISPLTFSSFHLHGSLNILFILFHLTFSLTAG